MSCPFWNREKVAHAKLLAAVCTRLSDANEAGNEDGRFKACIVKAICVIISPRDVKEFTPMFKILPVVDGGAFQSQHSAARRSVVSS